MPARRRRPAPAPPACRAAAVAASEEAPAAYLARVRRAKEYVRAGDIYQANLSRPWRVELRGPAPMSAALYERLRAANPAPFAALAQWRGVALLSSSPERLVRVAGRRIDTRPIAGTRPRSRRPGEDAREIAALAAHPKERAEHIMLIDLERNDLGRVCEAGTVRVDELMTIESYAHVHHIVSNVTGGCAAEVTPIGALRAVFPGGTITGCPKFRCMQIIAELEGEGRGAYTGSLGLLARDGSIDLNILIRTMTLAGGVIEFRAGAGIVADSDPERELEETRAKARGLLRLSATCRAPEPRRERATRGPGQRRRRRRPVADRPRPALRRRPLRDDRLPPRPAPLFSLHLERLAHGCRASRLLTARGAVLRRRSRLAGGRGARDLKLSSPAARRLCAAMPSAAASRQHAWRFVILGRRRIRLAAAGGQRARGGDAPRRESRAGRPQALQPPGAGPGARRAGAAAAAEALMLSRSGKLVSGTMTNVFLVDGPAQSPRLRTPASTCGVAGVMRRVVLREAARAGIAASECALWPADLRPPRRFFSPTPGSASGRWAGSRTDSDSGPGDTAPAESAAPLLEEPADG